MTHHGISPQSLVEHALAASMADDCVVIVRDSTSANLRWANNTLTTNGVMHGVRRVDRVVRQAGRRDLGRLGQRQRDHPGRGRRAGPRAPTRPPVPPRPPRTPPSWSPTAPRRDWADEPASTGIEVYDDVAPALGEAFGRSGAAGRVLYGFVNHEVTTTYLGSTTGLRLRHVQPTGHFACTGKTADLTNSAWVGRATRDFSDVDPLAAEEELAQRLAWGKHRVDLEAGRYDTIMPPTARGRPDDLRLLAGRRARRLGRASRCSAGTAPAPGSARSSTRPEVTLYSDPAYAGLQCAPFTVASASSNESSVFDNGLELGRTDWIRERRAHRAAPDPAHRRDDQAAGDSGHRQPRPRGRRRRRDGRGPGGRHRARSAADLHVVHPRGRPADRAAHRADPRRRLPRRERRDHRGGQQLPLEREPGRPAAALLAAPRRRCRASAASGATTTSRALRRPRCGYRTSTCRACRRRNSLIAAARGVLFRAWRQPWTESTRAAGPSARRAAHPADPAERRRRSRSSRAGSRPRRQPPRRPACCSPSSGCSAPTAPSTTASTAHARRRSHRLSGRRALRPGHDRVRGRRRLPVRGRRSRPDLRSRAAARRSRARRRPVRVDRPRPRVLRRPGQRPPRDVEPHQLRPGRCRRGALPDGGGAAPGRRGGRQVATAPHRAVQPPA